MVLVAHDGNHCIWLSGLVFKIDVPSNPFPPALTIRDTDGD